MAIAKDARKENYVVSKNLGSDFITYMLRRDSQCLYILDIVLCLSKAAMKARPKWVGRLLGLKEGVLFLCFLFETGTP